MSQASANPKPDKPVHPGQQQLAAVYAKAFLGAAQTAGQTDDAIAQFDTLVREVFDKHPELEKLLGSALVSHEEKLGQIDRLFGPFFSPALVDFLKVVSQHGRLDFLRAIHREVHRLDDEQRGRLRVLATTATPLDAQQKSGLEASLRKMFPGEPVLETVVDPQLIGGLVLRIGDTVYDGSVQRQLEQMREQMINRSVHEIQSRRDSFRHPGGN
jgi:F-type H+-transporting ATPase subunit delta